MPLTLGTLTLVLAALLPTAAVSPPPASPREMAGVVLDDTGGVLPGATIDLQRADQPPLSTVSDAAGRFRFDAVPQGSYTLVVRLLNFNTARRLVTVESGPVPPLSIALHLSLSADVLVTGRHTFRNLADAEDPAQNLVGIAEAASQGAVTGAQLQTRPVMRSGEVMETVPGVIVSQHSGDGKANQYYLRGFNLDHGTDFASTVAGIPVNMPTHAHGQGYSDLNFLIPELVSGVQYKKGPYYADTGDFSAAGAANVNYVNALDGPLVRLSGGQDGWGRMLAAASPQVGENGRLLAAFEVNHNNGPWMRPDDYRKFNAVVRYSRGTSEDGSTLTGMAYHGRWDSSDQIPERAVQSHGISRFGAVDPTDGGATSRYSIAAEWQVTGPSAPTRISAYGVKYRLDLFSNFTYFLDDPTHGDQFEQYDGRWIGGGRLVHRRLSHWGRHGVEYTAGAELRHDDIGALGLYHTDARLRLATVRQDAVQETSSGLFGEADIDWGAHLRTTVGLRGDVYRFDVRSNLPANTGTGVAGIVSPKAGVVFSPWKTTEFYANAGTGFHSNDARGVMLTVDPSTLAPASRVTPLVRARGAEVGARTIVVPHLQSTIAVWMLGLDSELVFAGDAGTTEASRPSHRSGVEWANYASLRPWLTLDADLAVSRARFTDASPAGAYIPGSVETVTSLGLSVDPTRTVFGSLRWRYFGPRPLVEDNHVRSRATSLVNGEVGYKIGPRWRLVLEGYNLLNASASDTDYYYPSRLPGEPAGGVDDLHFHPTVPRAVRLSMQYGF